MVRNSCLSSSISSRSYFSSSGSSPFFSSSAWSFFSSSLLTDCWMDLAFSSLGTKGDGVNWLAISPQSRRNWSDLGYSDGISKKNIDARRQAIEVMKLQWRSLAWSNSTGEGGRFGNVQKGFPSFVWASRGYTCKSCFISWLNSFSNRMRAYSTQSIKFLGLLRSNLRPSLRLIMSWVLTGLMLVP